MRIKKLCTNCNEEFKSWPSDNQKYCSKKCYRIVTKNLTVDIPKIIKGYTIKCLVCDKDFYLCKSQYNKNIRCCSKKCSGLNKKGKSTPNTGSPGNLHPLWNGGIGHNGKYKTIRQGMKNGLTYYKMEHRIIMENFIGRKLEPTEIIHHLNGEFRDNRIENLVLCKNKSEHLIIHDRMEKIVFKMIKENKIHFDMDKKEYFMMPIDNGQK